MKHTIKLLTLAFMLAAILTLTGCPGPVTPDMPCTHENKKTVIETAATCTETGLEKIICADCGELIEKNTIEALGHDFGEWTVTKEATCTADGEETRTCKREGCTHSKTRSIEKHHTWELESDTATCTEDGKKTYKCSRCDGTKTENSTALGHDYQGGYCETCEKYKFENRFIVRVYTSKDEFIKDISTYSVGLSSNNENNSPYDACKFSFESKNPSMTVDTLIHKKLRYLNYNVVGYKVKEQDTPISIMEYEEIIEESINRIYSILVEPQIN